MTSLKGLVPTLVEQTEKGKVQWVRVAPDLVVTTTSSGSNLSVSGSALSDMSLLMTAATPDGRVIDRVVIDARDPAYKGAKWLLWDAPDGDKERVGALEKIEQDLKSS